MKGVTWGYQHNACTFAGRAWVVRRFAASGLRCTVSTGSLMVCSLKLDLILAWDNPVLCLRADGGLWPSAGMLTGGVVEAETPPAQS